jgi:hypothetical protein
MGKPVAPDGIAQRRHHGILADQFGKALRTVFPGENAVNTLARRLGARQFAQVKTRKIGFGFAHCSPS